MRARHRLLATFAVGCFLACSGCGSGTHVNVIGEWARALTAGELDRAASYFALPAVVENGTPPVRVTTRAQVRQFNELLPCGARLVSTARHGAYIYATFRLTNRVGGDCRGGTGTLVATAFLIRNGKIAEWRRLPNPGSGPRTPASKPVRGAARLFAALESEDGRILAVSDFRHRRRLLRRCRRCLTSGSPGRLRPP